MATKTRTTTPQDRRKAGRVRGGKNRVASMTKAELSAAMRKAVMARWSADTRSPEERSAALRKVALARFAPKADAEVAGVKSKDRPHKQASRTGKRSS